MKVRKFVVEFTCDQWACDTVRYFDGVDDARDDGWISGRNGDFCCASCRDSAAKDARAARAKIGAQ